MSSHSKIGASSMYRWASCPGSVRLSAGIQSRSSEHALEGSAAHQLAEMCLNEEFNASYYVGSNMVLEKDGGSFEVPVTKEMADHVQVYLDYIRDGEPFDTLVEHRFHMSDLHPDLFGTADCVQFFPERELLRVTDLKFGMGIPVEVEGNVQGLFYALGALITLRFPARYVEIVIAQPRCPHPDGPIRSWTIGVDQLLEFQADLLDAVAATEKEDAPLVSGDWCRFCPAAGVPGRCTALEAKAQALAKVEFQPLTHYDPAKLAQALIDMPAVEARIKAIREFAYAEAEAGRCPPGFKLVEKRANRKWRDLEAAKAYFGNATEFYTEPELKSPAQCEKLMEKSERAKLEELTTKESSGHTLAPIDDKRPAVRLTAKEDFAALPLND